MILKIKKEKIEFNSLDDLLILINKYNLYSNLKSFNNIDKNILLSRLENKSEVSGTYISREFFRYIFKSNSQMQKLYWTERGYSEKEAKILVSEIQKENSKKSNIKFPNQNRYLRRTDKLKKDGKSDDEIREYWKLNSQYNIDYWKNKGLSEEEAKNKITLIQIENALKFTNKKKNNPTIYSAYTSTQIGFWINQGYDLKEAKLKLKERQRTFTKEKCIKKYGEIDGLIKWQDRQNKWIKSFHSNKNIQLGYSLVSQELFDLILEQYSEYEKDFIFYAEKNKEIILVENEYDFYFYDFCDLKQKKIIEFHGDVFHGNPEKFKADDKPHPFYKKITAQELWTKDEIKTNVAIKNGYEVLIIWEKLPD